MTDECSITTPVDPDSADLRNTLTNPRRMKEWMGGAEIKIEVDAGRAISSPILIGGAHYIKFINIL